MVALSFSPIFAPRSDLRDLCALCVKFLLVPCTDPFCVYLSFLLSSPPQGENTYVCK
jgi:hypothetical protein